METPRRPRPGFWFAGRFSPGEIDVMVTAAAVVGAVVVLVPRSGTESLTPLRMVVGIVVLLLGALSLLWRRSHPGPMLVVQGLAFALGIAAGADPAAGVSLVFGVYACALYGGPRVRVAAAVTAALVLLLAFAGLLADSRLDGGHLAVVTFGYGLAWIAGDRTRTHRAYLAALEERARQLERERDLQAGRAAEDERIRIARELHDVVAHNVSVIAVQAGAARVTADSEPRRALEALALIERTARNTLSELRSVLGLLRKGETPPRGPQPTLAQLDQLVEQARAAGIRVTSSVEGTPRALPEVVELCAFRLVQEALTNVIRHAPRAHTHVLAAYGNRELRITVLDDGPGIVATGTTGSGLIGMRERVALAGGELRAGPAPGGGFRIDATLPFDSAEVAEPAAGSAVFSRV